MFWIGERFERELHDEVQGQIMAGELDAGQTGPTGPGYLAVLGSLGFSTDPADYPVVDVTDDGIGNGTTTSGDPTFHELGSDANPTRLAYVANCTSAADGGGIGGHGHLNLSVAGSYDTRSGFPFQDPDGFQRGLGINPYGRFAGTRVFGPSFDLSSCGSTDTGLIQSEQDNGAQISTNSWGCSGCAGSYDDSSQAFDVGVRDADLVEAGNQELIFVFSAGNSGPTGGTIGTPGNGKNMITVGASENDRPSDEDGNWTDGCLIGPTGADDAMDVIGFSSRGPAPGARTKPELIAPGTHIHGTASTNAGYNGSGVCDQFRPSGQTTFAASSGTSHSTPAVAGLASLVYYWLENPGANITGAGAAPSPALMKAYLMAHTLYLTGVGAGGTLPSNSQGYGMPTLDQLFDDAFKFVVDQSEVFDNTGETWTWSGSVADSGLPVRITLAFTDMAGAIGTSPQVNDLDLEVEVGGMTYRGNVFSGALSTIGGSADAANNYEAVFLPAGTSGALEITVRATNVAGDGIPNSGDVTDQDFALVCNNCVQEPTFSLGVDPTAVGLCAPADGVFTIDVGSILGFTDAVTLSTSGEPAGSTVGFSTNPVTPPGTSTLTIGGTGGVTPGHYDVDVIGTSGAIVQERTVDLGISNGLPAAPTPTSPADGAVDQAVDVELVFSAVAGAESYSLEIATDAAFTNVVESVSDLTSTSYTPTSLDTAVQYFWRVRAHNFCGDGTFSAVFDFTTEPAPGDCAPGITPTELFSDDLESGAVGWSSSGTQDTWMLSSVRTHSGANAFHAEDVDSLSDQYLVSPAIVLPASAEDLTLQFWNHQTIEDSGAGCFDGGVVEISTDDGANWTRLEAELLTDPYDGAISTAFDNPLSGENAWCGDPQDWLKSVVDIDAWAGETVRFRFRLATDTSVGREGWYVDDVAVQACDESTIFTDGFESGNTSSWSNEVQP